MFSISQQEKIIRNDIKSIVADLLLLVNHHHLHSNLAGTADIGFTTVAEEFLIFSRQKKIYDQVRFIDAVGMEKIRINYNDGSPVIVPLEQLQFKGDRYYFKNTFRLQQGEVFISPFDLNMEQGVTEEPMIRFAAPVVNHDGRKNGIVILNYLGNEILHDIQELMAHSLGRLTLLNQTGYWLLGYDKNEERGFIYADKKDMSFAHHYPEAWATIWRSDSGLFYENGAMYTFDTIYPLQEGLKSSSGSREAYKKSEKSLSAHEYYWKIVSYIPENELRKRLHPDLFLYLLAHGLLALLIGIGSWLIVSFRIKQLQAERNLQKSELKFRTIADFSYDLDAWIRPDGSYAYISPSCERVTGYPQQCFLDDSGFFLEIIHPDDQNILTSHRLQHLDNLSGKVEVYFRIIMKSGETRWIWHQCQPVYAEDGTWLGRRTTNRDVTEKYRVEAALQRERDMFLRGPVATFTWRNQENWPVEQVSGNVFDILGYTTEEFFDGSVLYAQCIHPDDLDRVTEEVMIHSQGNESSFIHQPYRLVARSGAIVWVLDTTTIVRDANGGISHYLGYLVDISEQKRQERLVLKNSEQQGELKRLESLKTMAGAIAHRFNNSMMAVQGNLELMSMILPDDSDGYRMASNAAQAARGASKVGSMMLSYVGQRPLQLEEVSLVDLVKENITALKNVIPSTITLNFTLPKTTLRCAVDQNQIKEVIESILANAVEAIEDTGTIGVSFGACYLSTDSLPIPFRHQNLHDGLYVFFQINDSGHGIRAENFSRIFEPFYSTRFVGRGLGLPLTMGIMQAHCGTLTLESDLSSGTVFRVLLPSISPPQVTTPSFGEIHREKETLSGHILLADDDEMVLDVGGKLIEVLGFTVHPVVDGEKAVEEILRQNICFCAVILDISMPKMDGFSAMKAIREIDSALPILLSSGYSEDVFFQREGEKDKADGFLMKPFNLSEIRSILEKLLS
ncbi:MAG: PAS domain S-box protein [Candidatus Electrothrix sp. AR4]|nr:PAS domain S-box protein [Candidatus Electrothrix sp. AR4]